jgi:hypothetical protein
LAVFLEASVEGLSRLPIPAGVEISGDA